jgi:ABC-type nickel/cobalt efflux system permease component RcnA
MMCLHLLSFNCHSWGRKKITFLATVFLFAIMVVLAGSSTNCHANPLTGKRNASTQGKTIDSVPASGIFSDIIAKTTILQMQLKEKISAHVHDFKNSGSIAPLLPLFLLAFLYGAVHAAGPGHGKAIAMSYVLAKGKGCLSGFVLGGLIAVIHASSAICLVIILRFILEKTISTSLASATKTTQLFSYGLIGLIGLYLLVTGIYSVVKGGDTENGEPPTLRHYTNSFTAALAIGIIPCPGVIMILLFCLSLDQFVLGLFLCATVSLGMALTISVSVWIILIGKNLILKFTGKSERIFYRTEHILTCVSGVLLTAMGGVFFAASL